MKAEEESNAVKNDEYEMIDELPLLEKPSCFNLYKYMTIFTFKQYWMSGVFYTLVFLALMVIIFFVAALTPKVVQNHRDPMLTYTDVEGIYLD